MATEIVSEISSFFGGGKDTVKTPSPEKKSQRLSSTSESMESTLSRYLEKDKENETEEIIPCCLYFFWGSYLACCTEVFLLANKIVLKSNY